MDDETAKKIGEHIKKILVNQDKEVVKASIDGSEKPDTFKISYVSEDRTITKTEVKLPE